MASPAAATTLPEIKLAQVPELATRLAARVRAAGFVPDVIVYVERGARLPAAALCREFGCGAIAVEARRGGAGLKRVLAPLARIVPQGARNWLRRCEERWFWQRGVGQTRNVTSSFIGSLSGRRVLVVDDAADSGRTIFGCRAWLAAHGVPPTHLRVAVLAATAPTGRAACDFWLLEENTRLPWSSDSGERAAAEAAMEQDRPPAHA